MCFAIKQTLYLILSGAYLSVSSTPLTYLRSYLIALVLRDSVNRGMSAVKNVYKPIQLDCLLTRILS